LMESVSSCILLLQVLSCLTNSSSVFPLISSLSSSFEILFSTLSSLVEWSSTVFCVSVSYFFSEVFHIVGHFLFSIVYFNL
jgi:hypothetical protein